MCVDLVSGNKIKFLKVSKFSFVFFRAAEQFLEKVDHNRNFPQLLLMLIDKDEVDMTIRTAGAIAFKNYVKRNWGRPVENPDQVCCCCNL